MFSELLQELKRGQPVLIFDSEKREGETDIVVPSQFVTPDLIRFMRKNGGGLICTTLRESEAGILGLPYIEDFYRKHLELDRRAMDSSDLRYDKNSSFSVTINSRRTFTGISDNDRSTTITEFAELMGKIIAGKVTEPRRKFSEEFRIPGHISLIIARDGYCSSRRGHTELSTYLLERSELIPSATIVEMLDDNGLSLNREKAEKFAADHRLKFIDGDSIIRWWNDDNSDGHRGIRHSAPGAPALS
jgi:3,4-dihydroxy 2-butanone 4-phosphate synthase